jgi:hypothetical protein
MLKKIILLLISLAFYSNLAYAYSSASHYRDAQTGLTVYQNKIVSQYGEQVTLRKAFESDNYQLIFDAPQREGVILSGYKLIFMDEHKMSILQGGCDQDSLVYDGNQIHYVAYQDDLSTITPLISTAKSIKVIVIYINPNNPKSGEVHVAFFLTRENISGWLWVITTGGVGSPASAI